MLDRILEAIGSLHIFGGSAAYVTDDTFAEHHDIDVER